MTNAPIPNIGEDFIEKNSQKIRRRWWDWLRTTIAAASTGFSITDGTHTVNGTNSLTISGGTVGGTTPNATLTIAGGGGGGNVTPDSHPTSSTAWNDEFEFGSTLDTTGSRFAGANPWTVKNANSTTTTLLSGSLLISAAGGSGNNDTVFAQPLAGVGATWAFTEKRTACDNIVYTGLFIGFAATGKGYYFGVFGSTIFVISQTTYTGTGAAAAASTSVGSNGAAAGANTSIYLQIGFDGTNLTFKYSWDGLVFFLLLSVPPATFLGGAPDTVGIMAGATAVTSGFNISAAVDWFRRTL